MGHVLTRGEGFARQEDLGGREVAAIGDGWNAAALDVLAEDLGFIGCRQLDVVIAGETDAVVGRVDERFEVGDDGDAGRDADRVMPPAGDLLVAQLAVGFPVGRQLAANGWTTQARRLSQFVPLPQPLGFVIEGQSSSSLVATCFRVGSVAWLGFPSPPSPLSHTPPLRCGWGEGV